MAARLRTQIPIAAALVAAAALLAAARFGAPAAPAQAAITAVSTGARHACAVDADGALTCWGDNSRGQLGEGSTTPHAEPVLVDLPVGAPAASVAAGRAHTCALTTAGEVLCWGSNDAGQIGGAGDSLTPRGVAGLSAISALAAGDDHTCALTAQGSALCWGSNSHGQLGDGSGQDQPAPAPVQGLAGAAQIDAGAAHTCAVTTQGAALCWGAGADGQLGSGARDDQPIPAPVVGLESAAGISAGGSHTCARTTGGAAFCWGSNSHGQLGDGSGAGSALPVAVAGLASDLADIAAGAAHTCARLEAGDVRCWGQGDAGELGTGRSGSRPTPAAVVGLGAPALAIDAGDAVSCAILEGGALACWGSSADGILGSGAIWAARAPVAGPAFDGIERLAAFRATTCVVTAAGGALCWGENRSGQLGDGTAEGAIWPAAPVGLDAGVQEIAPGASHACALNAADQPLCWGDNSHGQLGDGSTAASLTPVTVTGSISGVTALAAGGSTSCALIEGEVRCWGYGFAAQAQPAPGLEDGIVEIEAGSAHLCARTAAGAALCLGENASGQLGDGSFTPRAQAAPAAGLEEGVERLSAGFDHTCAVLEAGAVRCWGDGRSGQLGDGFRGISASPVEVAGLPAPAIAVAAGSEHTCALLDDGRVFCWGSNRYGQAGDGAAGDLRLEPVEVVGLGDGVAALAAGEWHTCALTWDGALFCWGLNASGQLGRNPGWQPVVVQAGARALVYLPSVER